MAPLSLEWLAARCDVDEETGCMAWKHNCCNGTDPRAKLGGKKINVRREVWKHAHPDKLLSPKSFVGVNCHEPLCVNPDHVVSRSRSQAIKGAKRQQSSIIKGVMTRRRNSKLPQDKVAEILVSPLSGPQMAREVGVCVSMVNYIRAGKVRRDYSSPFAGLMR